MERATQSGNTAAQLIGTPVVVALWIGGYLILPRIGWWTGGVVPSWIALLDIASSSSCSREMSG
jgi:hypothetical protein